MRSDPQVLLTDVTRALERAGETLVARFRTRPRHASRADVVAALRASDEASLGAMRGALLAARPGATWIEDELEEGALPAGEFWVVDPVEGNIHHAHGTADWGVTATLVRDGEPWLTAVHLPLAGTTYTAVAGEGAHVGGTHAHAGRDGEPLRVSSKRALDGALVGTGQARPGEAIETLRRLGASVTAMLERALLVQMTVPATLQLVDLAAGRLDVFWQYSGVRSGLVAGALLVREAGGTVTDTRGRPWNLASADFVAASPSLHASAVDALSSGGAA